MPRPNKGPRLHTVKGRDAFYILWYDRGTKCLRSTGTSDRREAEAALAKFIGTSHRGSGPREPSDVGVAEVLSTYLEHKAASAIDPARIAYAVSALLPFWQRRTVADITRQSCADYARHRGKAPGTIRRELATITAAQNFMVGEQLLTRAVPVELPQRPQSKDRWLTVSEAARLLNEARHGGRETRSYLPLFIMLGLYTGARKEAILSLHWSQIDMEKRRIRFAVEGRATTKKRRPTIPIPRRLMTFLRLAWKRRSSDTGPVLHIAGEPIQRIDKGFRTTVARAGLANVTPHTLRHTRCTWLAQSGMNLWEAASYVGMDPETFNRVYAHHSPDFMKGAVDAVDNRR